jgi:hypothetical protein
MLSIRTLNLICDPMARSYFSRCPNETAQALIEAIAWTKKPPMFAKTYWLFIPVLGQMPN